MKYIKNELRNRMGDQWMNDCLVVYIEKYVASNIDNKTIMQEFCLFLDLLKTQLD